MAVESPAPSPFCHEILNSNPYSYLDDAPLEERRTRAVNLRRSLSPDVAGKLGAFDPAAIDAVVEEAWPVVRDADELHDALLTLVWLPYAFAEPWNTYFPELIDAGRVIHVENSSNDAISGWMPTEHYALAQAVFPNAKTTSPSDADRPSAILTIVRGWMESIGPITADELAKKLQLPLEDIDTALLGLETQGQVLRGQFRSTGEWCDRRLLARIHRRTLGKLRKEIEPVSSADFMRFLVRWQHVAPGTLREGRRGVLSVVEQLQGCEAATEVHATGPPQGDGRRPPPPASRAVGRTRPSPQPWPPRQPSTRAPERSPRR